MSQTPNYHLHITDSDTEKFKVWREQMNGPENSNMTKIDTALHGLAEKSIAQDGAIAEMRTMVGGTPKVAETLAEMTEHDRIYVYTGEEAGMVAGNWYHYNGTAWVSGGVYNAVAVDTDKTLLVSDQAADSKVTGDRIRELDNNIANVQAESDQRMLAIENEMTDIAIDPDNLGLYQDPDTGFVYVTYKGQQSSIGIPLAGGGGGGGGGGPINNAVMTLDNMNPGGWISKAISFGQTCILLAKWSSLENDVPTGNGTLIVKVDGVTKASYDVPQGDLSIDITKYLHTNNNRVRISVTDVYGNVRMLAFSINCAEFSISSTFDQNVIFSAGSEIQFPYVVKGTGDKIVYFVVDGTQVATAETSKNGGQIVQNLPGMTHGSHTILVYFTAEVSGSTVRSNELYYEVAVAASGNPMPIISSSFRRATASQYETLNIPYRVYNPSSLTANVDLYVGDALVNSLTVDRTEQVWVYRPNEVGSVTLHIRTTQGSVVVEKQFVLTVEAADITIEPVEESLVLHLSAYGRNNAEENPATWSDHGISASFSGFTWGLDGWHTDSDGIDVLRLSENARLTIPYKIFDRDFKTNGKTIEIEFATREVINYNAEILTCFADGIGLKITPQMVTFKGAQTEISTLYKDNEHIRLTIVVGKQAESRLLLIYINGIMSRAVQYAAGERFSQLTPVDISIGSNDCGIDLYNIRIYDNALNRREVVGNWIADTQIGSVMLERYDHNNVYEGDDITPNSIPADLPYFILEAPELPQFKGDKKTISGSYTDRENPSKSFTFENCQINVQGTSSAPYFRKNYDMQFKGGFTTSNGTVDNYGIKNTSIPFNRFVLKADVASSESTNNTGLTSFYNDTCPYKTPEMLANPRVRWGIEGVPIAVFWHDTANNTTQFMGKYNFNLPKRAPEPYGYSGTMESWEWERNNSANVKFQDNDFTTMAWDEVSQSSYPEWYDDFEARFPSDEHRDIRKLNEMLSWVKSTWREQATGAALAAPVEYTLDSTATVNAYTDDNSFTVTREVVDGSETGRVVIRFTKDTPAYRLTRFRVEFSDYFEVRSATYYYLFTEFFLMIDSRAKNMFIGFNGSPINDPNREMDRKATLQPYDMDTAIGTNNSGVLMFGYALEDTDHVSSIISGGDSGGKDAPVFNAQDSVLWCNFRDAFRPEIVAMYRDLRTSGTWSYEAVEGMFEAHQSKWPEAIFNEDAYTKYIVPLVEEVTYDEDSKKYIKTDRYLTMLQGSKKEQRKWWLSNRFRYMDSKYVTGDAASKTITMRLFNAGTLNLTPAIDMYVGVSFGGGTTPQLSRTTANTPVPFAYVPKTGVTEMETWVYSADLITDVGDLSVFYGNEFDFSRATKLKRLKIGDSSASYSNANLTTLNVQNSVLLEHIDVRNCPNLASSINLEGSPRLKEAYFGGTSITGVSLGDGCAIETLQLPGTITALEMFNLNRLTTFTCPSLANVTRLMLTNMNSSAVNPVAILNQIPANSQVNIQGLRMEATSSSEVSAFFEKLDAMDGVTRERSIDGEWLYYEHRRDDPNEVDNRKACFSGTIHIAGTVNGADLALFNSKYPYITVTADHTVSVLRFCNWDGSDLPEPYNTQTIIDGGNGTVYMGDTPTRAATPQVSYTFCGWSLLQNQRQADANALRHIVADRTVYAAYIATGQKYTVRFYNGTTLLQTVENVFYGDSAEYTGATPEYEADPENFAFSGWEPSNENIQGETNCYAQYLDMRSPVVRYLDGSIEEYESNSLQKIKNYAFYNLKQLKTFKAPATYVGIESFRDCSGLELVDLSSTDQVEIKAGAFNGATKMALIIRSEEMPIIVSPQYLTSCFEQTFILAGLRRIYVADHLLDIYKTTTPWSFALVSPLSQYPINSYETITDTWEEIFAAEDDGTYSTKYSVGDIKTVSIDGFPVLMQIVAFDTDDLSDESGKAKITWIAKNALNSEEKMNNSRTDIGGWAQSYIRGRLNEYYISKMPSLLQSRIQSVSKTYFYVDSSGGYNTDSVSDRIWIPSAKEILGSSTQPRVESDGYTYWSSPMYKVKVESDLSKFLLRYPTRTGSGKNGYVLINGSKGTYASIVTSSDTPDPIIIGFCT